MAGTSLRIDINQVDSSSPYLFGHNLEHTRACVSGGLSAQMLRNRKFAGRPQARLGVAAEWFGIGECVFFCNDAASYVKHYTDNGMRRRNDLNAQTVQNAIEGQTAGIGQGRLFLQKGKEYTIAIVCRATKDTGLTVCLTDESGEKIYAQHALTAVGGDEWTRYEFPLIMNDDDDARAALRITFTSRCGVTFGAVSMLPEGHFHGMRADVVACLKALGVGILRWPGGNFAGEYRWLDMLLPVDQRAPLQAYTEDETQPYTHGYDNHEIDTDDFIALCREIGAEPFITINLAWDTPEQCAAWVEYCNGSKDTPYGKIRAARGHDAPYHVRYWSLGNEMGYGHMEGPMEPSQYAAMAAKSAMAMLSVSPDLVLCSSGPYENQQNAPKWIAESAEALKPYASYISFHTYNVLKHDYTTDEGMLDTYKQALAGIERNLNMLRALREKLSAGIHISYDEWNIWAAWFRRSGALEGMFAARMLHTLMTESDALDATIMCFFQPIGEGAIDVYPDRAELTAVGQAFDLLKVHKGAPRCHIDGENNYAAYASVRDGAVSTSLINTDCSNERVFALRGLGQVIGCKGLIAGSFLPGTRFSACAIKTEIRDDELLVTLPPCSVALVQTAN